jgi:hypothetical protein
MCVQLLHPTVRYVAKNRGTVAVSSLRVDALIEDPLTGRVLAIARSRVPVGTREGERGDPAPRRSCHS